LENIDRRTVVSRLLRTPLQARESAQEVAAQAQLLGGDRRPHLRVAPEQRGQGYLPLAAR
jgi:hypothetical protein